MELRAQLCHIIKQLEYRQFVNAETDGVMTDVVWPLCASRSDDAVLGLGLGFGKMFFQSLLLALNSKP